MSIKTAMIAFVVSSIIGIYSLKICNKYFFTIKDLTELVQDKGGTLSKKKLFTFGQKAAWTKAQIKNFWLMVKLGNPGFIKSYPKEESDWVKDSMGNRLYGQASVFQLGDFSKFPNIDLLLTKDMEHMSSSMRSSDSVLYEAIIGAVCALKDPDLVLTLEIRGKWLRVRIMGGHTLGKIFGERILQALEVTDHLVAGLSSNFTPYDTDEWTIDVKSDLTVLGNFKVSPVENSERVI